MTLATTGSNALRHRGDGLGRVLYWTYTKYPLGESWEAYFPTTIYLVGCNPPFSVSLYCTGDSTKKVLYHSDDTCSVTNPGGDYVISYDRRAYCPIDLSEICEEGEDPPEGIVVVEKTTVDLCLAVGGDTISWLGSLNVPEPGYCAVVGCCVEAWWKVLGAAGCLQLTSDISVALSFPEGAMTGNSTDGWTLGPVSITPEGKVSVGGTANYGGSSVSFTGEGSDIALDGVYHCPVGASTIPIIAVSWSGYNYLGQPDSGVCCPEGTQCGSHAWVCAAGTITITTSIRIGGTC